jgi:hypothetical protein
MKAWCFWVGLWSRREAPTTLAVFRILVALVVLFSLGSAIHADVVSVVWRNSPDGGMRTLFPVHPLTRWLGTSPEVADGLLTGALLGAVFMLLGLFGRWPILLTLQCYLALTSLSPTTSGSYDALITNALWILFLSRSTASLSLDCRLSQGEWLNATSVPAWPRHLLIVQLMFVYFVAGLSKVGAGWELFGNATALHYILYDPVSTWGEPGYPPAFAWLFDLGTRVTVLFEYTAPVLLLVYYFRATRIGPGRLRRWFNRFDLRIPWALCGIALHLGILALMDVGPFSHISLAYYVCLWHPREISRWATRQSPSITPHDK